MISGTHATCTQWRYVTQEVSKRQTEKQSHRLLKDSPLCSQGCDRVSDGVSETAKDRSKTFRPRVLPCGTPPFTCLTLEKLQLS